MSSFSQTRQRSKRQSWGARCVLILVLALGMMPLETWAKQVYLNGVQITGLASRTFKDVSVRLDAKGNVYITGKQYQVVRKVVGGGTASAQPKAQPKAQTNTAPSAAKLNKGYVLVMQRSGKYGSGYRLEISVNGKVVRKVSVHMTQDVFNLNPYLKRGRNTIVIESFKVKRNVGGSLTVQMSHGSIKGGKVYIKPPYFLKYKRVSTENNNFRHIFPVTIN